MPRASDLFLHDMDHAAKRLLAAVEGKTLEDVLADELLQESLLWNLTKLGEAAKRIPKELRDAHPEVDWRRARRMRDFVVHVYFGVDWRLLYKTVQRSIPKLLAQLEGLLESASDGPHAGL